MELDKALECLRHSTPCCSIVRSRAPSYIRVHTCVDEDICLVNVKSEISSAAVSQTNGDAHQEILELTGSPLKLDLSLRNILEDTMPLDETQHWCRDEISHLPTTLQVARNVCNEYIKLTKELEKDQSTPLWVVTNGTDKQKTLLLSTHSYKNHFDRGVVSYEGEIDLDELSFEKLSETDVQLTVECRLRMAGMSSSGHVDVSDLTSAPHPGLTQLRCEWNERTLEIPTHSARVTLEQEVIVGHEMSPCRVLWRSICALNSINRTLVDMQAAGYATIALDSVDIRPPSTIAGPTRQDTLKRLNHLLSEVETYTYTAQSQKGGCIFIPEDATSLKQCLNSMESRGSSNDFAYKLWDILKDSETAEDVLTLLLHALKAVSSGKMKPFITPSNKTYLAKLILKLSRGHSQTSTVLKNLRSSPHQALSLLGQLGVEKTSWELTHLFTLVDNSFSVGNVLSLQKSSDETIAQINQTIHDMTMGCGDLTLNPFENKSAADSSARLNSESFLDDEQGELSIGNFASLRKHGLVSGEKTADEVPLILDEIDISGWRKILGRFAQLYVCLEHLNRMQQVLRLDMASVSCRATHLQEQYLSDKSPVRTVSQLLSEPVQAYSTPVSAALLREHLNNKLASFYRVHISRRVDEAARIEVAATTHVFSQRPVFPPGIWRACEAEIDVNNTVNTGTNYHHTKYLHLSTNILTHHNL